LIYHGGTSMGDTKMFWHTVSIKLQILYIINTGTSKKSMKYLIWGTLLSLERRKPCTVDVLEANKWNWFRRQKQKHIKCV